MSEPRWLVEQRRCQGRSHAPCAHNCDSLIRGTAPIRVTRCDSYQMPLREACTIPMHTPLDAVAVEVQDLSLFGNVGRRRAAHRLSRVPPLWSPCATWRRTGLACETRITEAHENTGEVARPERLELPTFCFVGRRSIQLSYGRILGYCLHSTTLAQLIRVRAPGRRLKDFL
jgi:hypothetical protein